MLVRERERGAVSTVIMPPKAIRPTTVKKRVGGGGGGGGGGLAAPSADVDLMVDDRRCDDDDNVKEKKMKANNAVLPPPLHPPGDRVTYPRRSLPPVRDVVPGGGGGGGGGALPGRTGAVVVGRVRATPPGHMLNRRHRDDDDDDYDYDFDDDGGDGEEEGEEERRERWDKVRSAPNKFGTFAREGFDHVLGAREVRDVDGTPVGGRVAELDGPYHRGSSGGGGGGRKRTGGGGRAGGGRRRRRPPPPTAELEPEEEDALRAELAGRRLDIARMEETGLLDDIDRDTHRRRPRGDAVAASTAAADGHEYGASRTPLDAPIGSLREKWRVLPHFLKLRGLMRQHIDSFDHFVSVEMRQIVQVSHSVMFGFRYDFWGRANAMSH